MLRKFSIEPRTLKGWADPELQLLGTPCTHMPVSMVIKLCEGKLFAEFTSHHAFHP